MEIIRLRQVATLATRPEKAHRSLPEMTHGWRRRARSHLGGDQVAWVIGLKDRNDLPLLRPGDLSEEMLVDAAEVALASVAERRATFARTNLLDEPTGCCTGFASPPPTNGGVVAERIADLAAAHSLTITPTGSHHTPARYVRATAPQGCGQPATSLHHPSRPRRARRDGRHRRVDHHGRLELRRPGGGGALDRPGAAAGLRAAVGSSAGPGS